MKNQSFDSFDFKPLIKQAVEQLHFIKPTEIQQELIPAILNGQIRVAMVKSQRRIALLLETLSPIGLMDLALMFHGKVLICWYSDKAFRATKFSRDCAAWIFPQPTGKLIS